MNASIDEILAKIDRRLDDVRVMNADMPAASIDPLSEVGLYISVDRLLADLYRQYLEAQKNYITALQDHGAEGAMTEIASEMSESAFWAMETRLIELRQDQNLAQRVQEKQAEQQKSYVESVGARRIALEKRCLPAEKRVSKMSDQQSKAHFWAMMALSFIADFAPAPRPIHNDFAHAAA